MAQVERLIFHSFVSQVKRADVICSIGEEQQSSVDFDALNASQIVVSSNARGIHVGPLDCNRIHQARSEYELFAFR
jgi:hypothetical protein